MFVDYKENKKLKTVTCQQSYICLGNSYGLEHHFQKQIWA